jgi:hypothetical protein
MTKPIRKADALCRQNSACARRLWALKDSKPLLRSLGELTTTFAFSICLGDLTLLDNKWYVTHAGLLEFCDPSSGRWVFKATVYKSPKSKGFVGYGDADPSNVSPVVRGAEMRVAETRAVNRALRKAYGIGLCSVEEIGSFPSPSEPSQAEKTQPAAAPTASGNGQPRLRDRLCQLIRQHELDPALVKRYAADFCGTETLRGASRDLVETFVSNLADWAAKDRPGLVCHLNGYAQKGGARK